MRLHPSGRAARWGVAKSEERSGEGSGSGRAGGGLRVYEEGEGRSKLAYERDPGRTMGLAKQKAAMTRPCDKRKRRVRHAVEQSCEGREGGQWFWCCPAAEVVTDVRRRV